VHVFIVLSLLFPCAWLQQSWIYPLPSCLATTQLVQTFHAFKALQAMQRTGRKGQVVVCFFPVYRTDWYHGLHDANISPSVYRTRR